MSENTRAALSTEELIALYETLDAAAQRSLSDFAGYLSASTEPVNLEIPEPTEIARPEDETVVGAIKRLKASYFMIESMSVFSKASSLMTAHMMNGRDATEVIDEMEQVFETAYQELLDARKK